MADNKNKALLTDIHKADLNSFHHVSTQEKDKLPTGQEIKQEKTEQELRNSIGEFKKSQLKPAKTEEKNPLPDKQTIVKEKTEQELINSISDFKKDALKHTNTQEKVVLPTKADIEKEKSGA